MSATGNFENLILRGDDMTQEQKQELQTLIAKIRELEKNGNMVGYVTCGASSHFVDFSYIKEEFEKDTKKLNATEEEIWDWHTRQESNGYSEHFITFDEICNNLDDTINKIETLQDCNDYISLYRLLEIFNLNTSLFEDDLY